MSIRHQTHHIWKFHTSLQFSVHPQFLLVLDWSSAQIKFHKKNKRKCVAQIWDSAFGWFWQKSCGKVSRWLVGRVTEPPFLLCLPLLTIIFLIIFRLIFSMLSCLIICNLTLSSSNNDYLSHFLFKHLRLSNKL